MSYKRFWCYDKGGDRDGPTNWRCSTTPVTWSTENEPIETIEIAAYNELKAKLDSIYDLFKRIEHEQPEVAEFYELKKIRGE